VTNSRLELTREQILAFRRRVGALDERLPAGGDSLRRAAWAGLQDSMPRAAVLSIHARVAGTEPSTWEDPSLAQVWGPRFAAYVVAAEDVPVFTLGRMPTAPRALQRAEETADRLDVFLAGRKLTYGEAGRGLVRNPNSLRYGTTTGRIRIRWDGARQPTVWMVPPPQISPREAQLELARRHLHVFGPTTSGAFARWAGIKPPVGAAAFEALKGELAAVRTPIGDERILASDEAAIRATPAPTGGPRLLPSGDTFYLLQGVERELLVPDAARRPLLWTSRVWPGALLVDGEVAGTWRRSEHNITIEPWRTLSASELEAVEVEAGSLPLPALRSPIRVSWAG
jgi:hypothetical protein